MCEDFQQVANLIAPILSELVRSGATHFQVLCDLVLGSFNNQGDIALTKVAGSEGRVLDLDGSLGVTRQFKEA